MINHFSSKKKKHKKKQLRLYNKTLGYLQDALTIILIVYSLFCNQEVCGYIRKYCIVY